PAVSAALGLNYQASRLWGLNLSFLRDPQVNPSGSGGFTEVNSLRVGYHHKIRRAVLNLGLSYQVDNALANDGTSSGGSNQDYLSLDGSISMPMFYNTCNGSVFLRYSDEDRGSATN